VATVAALLLASLKLPWLTQILPSLLVGVLTAYLGYSYGLNRFYLLAVYTVLAGLPIALLNLGDRTMMPFFLGSLALGWLASGALTLRSYLSQTRPQTEVTE
jgi:hypothetical protein